MAVRCLTRQLFARSAPPVRGSRQCEYGCAWMRFQLWHLPKLGNPQITRAFAAIIPQIDCVERSIDTKGDDSRARRVPSTTSVAVRHDRVTVDSDRAGRIESTEVIDEPESRDVTATVERPPLTKGRAFSSLSVGAPTSFRFGPGASARCPEEASPLRFLLPGSVSGNSVPLRPRSTALTAHGTAFPSLRPRSRTARRSIAARGWDQPWGSNPKFAKNQMDINKSGGEVRSVRWAAHGIGGLRSLRRSDEGLLSKACIGA